MPMTPGPRRLILIRSGNYDYADVVLGNSTHLVGPNNVGKTSLIGTVQFLYIAAFTEMRFSRPWDESLRYYFHSDESTILFETVTADGRFVTLGLRGRGQLGNYQVDRFAFEGAYQEIDFLREDKRVRPFPEVKAILAGERYFKFLEPHEIRAAVVGEFRDTPALNMGIVPLKNPARYGDFVYLLKNLLRLNHLSQKDIKDTLLNVYRHDIKHAVEIDLHREYADHYAALTAERAKLDNLRKVAALAASLKQNRDRRDLARRDLPTLYVALVGAKAREVSALESAAVDRETERVQLDEADSDAESRKETLEGENNEIVGDLTRLQDWITAVETEADTLKDFLPDWAAEERRALAKEIDDLTARIVLCGDPAALERDLEAARGRLQVTTEQRDKHAMLLGTRIQEQLGRETIVDVGRIFHPGILRLPVEDGGIVLTDEASLLATLKEIHGKVKEGWLCAAGVEVPLDRVASADSVAVADLATLNAEIAELEGLVARTAEALETARNMEQLIAKRDGLRIQFQEALKLADRHTHWQQNSKLLPGKRKDLAGLRKRQTANLDARNTLIDEAKKRVNQRNSIVLALEGYKTQRRELDAIRPIGVDPKWPVGAPDPEWASFDARTLCSLYVQTRTKYDEADAEVARVLQEAEIVYQDGFAGPTDDERIEALIEAVDTLRERDGNFKRYLSDVIKGMRATFNNMFQAYHALDDSVAGISRAIGKVSISNLQQLSIELVENTEVTKHYRSVSSPDLFDDMHKVEEAIKTVYAAIDSTRVLRLSDWFGVRFVVTTANGEVRRYDDLTVMESNGTTMAIKVLVNIVLIRDMMLNKKPFRLPFYIDEAAQIDESNLREIVMLANEKGFGPVLASTVPASVAENIDFVRRVGGGRAVIDPKWRIERRGKDVRATAG